MNGRRLLIQPTFQLILIHKSPFPDFPQELASTTTIVDFRPHTEGVVRYFQMRGLERINPHLYAENSRVYFRLFRCLSLLERVDRKCMSMIIGKKGSGLWEETEMITDLVEKRAQVCQQNYCDTILVNLIFLGHYEIVACILYCCTIIVFNSNLNSILNLP